MDGKLRIGFVCMDDAADVKSWSGIPYHLLYALREQGACVEVFSPLQSNFRLVLGPIKAAARLFRRDIIFNHFPIALRSYAKQLKQRMQQRPVDVLLSIGTPPWTLLDCPEPIIFFTDAVFHSMHGYYSGPFGRLTAAATRRGIWQEERALQRCTFGAYASSWAADVARKYTQPEKIRVVCFGANMPVEHSAADVKRWIEVRLTRLSHECHLLFVGVDWVRKGGRIAVEAAGLLNKMGINTRLTVVGCQPSETLPPYVNVLGFLNKQSSEGQTRLRELFRDATFFILPTQAEAAGIVFCEASAFGLPSIAFATGGVEDYVHEGINGVCLPLESTPQTFAKSIFEIVRDKERYTALSLGAFDEYQTRLNWNHAASLLMELCHEAVQFRKGPSV